MNNVYIGLGSNLNNPIKQLSSALKYLSTLPFIHNMAVSSFYSSKPVGPQDQPDFVNAVVFFNTELAPIKLLDKLQEIEQSHHRTRKEHWGPRTLDLDILLYNDESINISRLTIPHPFMLERGFVIQPLNDLAPDRLLANGKTVSEQLHQLDTNDLVFIKEE